MKFSPEILETKRMNSMMGTSLKWILWPADSNELSSAHKRVLERLKANSN
jgi:hypothetical protein